MYLVKFETFRAKIVIGPAGQGLGLQNNLYEYK